MLFLSLKFDVSNLIFPKTKIDAREHQIQPLRVHTLLSDFELEDVWRVPVNLTSEHNLQLFISQFDKTNTTMVNKGVTGLLFRIRLSIGRWLKWDERHLQENLVPGSIRFRYAQQENLTYEDLPHPGTGNFIPVYKLQNEFLSEIENKTVQAALHFSRVRSAPDRWSIHMAVYVKPKGWFGKSYMLLIKPFRIWIVYPALMNAAKENWEGYLKSTESGVGAMQS
jgi:hypothetical protein